MNKNDIQDINYYLTMHQEILRAQMVHPLSNKEDKEMRRQDIIAIDRLRVVINPTIIKEKE